jgi:hypothetical protein
MNTLEIDNLLKNHPHSRPVFKGSGDVCHAMSCASMNKVKNAMKSAHDRSFFLYSNDIVSPMKAMFAHEMTTVHNEYARDWQSIEKPSPLQTCV